MNMGLLAPDLSLGSSVKESGSVVVRHHDKQHLVYRPVSPCDLRALESYHKALEEERLKIQAFERELPFCMQLLENAIEASKEQLEERLACKLNTPMHEPQLAAASHEFVCDYTSSLSHSRSSLPALGEINLRFKRKWTSIPSASTHDHAHPYNRVASTCTTKWLLPQNTKLSQNEDTPITCIKGSIKVQEFSIPEYAQPAADEPHKTSSEIGWDTIKSTSSACINATPSHALHLHNPKQVLSSLPHPQIQEEKYMLGKMQEIYDPDVRCCPPALPLRSIHDVACLDANGSPSTYMRPLCPANLGPNDLQLSNAMSSTLSKASFHGNSITLQSGGVQRKPRRCWSPELHQRFLSALNHLGGCQVATPKQIRELMNVEGLTNDEVKSHLQKFRLHMRRPNGVLASSQGESQQAAGGRHLVVFGHIWVPPEYGDQHHQHATNANINMISSELSAANHGAMELMKSFRSSGRKLISGIEHGNDSGQGGHVDSSNQRRSCGAAQPGLLSLCQEEYSSDQEELYERETLMYKSAQQHDEGIAHVASTATDVESERARASGAAPQGQGDGHVGISKGLCANIREPHESQEEPARAGVSKEGEHRENAGDQNDNCESSGADHN